MKKSLVLIVFILITTISFGQKNNQDLICLKNDNISHTIIEQIPDKSIQCKTSDEKVLTYKRSKVIQEMLPERKKSKEKKNTNNVRKFIGLEIGANIPIDKSLDDNFKTRKTGLQANLINIDYLAAKNIGATATFLIATNRVQNISGSEYSWTYGGVLAGPLFTIPISQRMEWDFRPMLGVAWKLKRFEKLDWLTDIIFSVGSRVRFNINHTTALTIGADYVSTKSSWTKGKLPIKRVVIKGGFAFRL